ncbi:MAG: UbiA family prenyltransferase [Gemmataceae bacterium]
MTSARILAFAQLLRLPNVFTAFADICLAACAAGYATTRPGVFALLLLASGCLYLAGMAWNDFFDRHEDAKTRSSRPIPSGRVRPATAAAIGGVLMTVGVGLAGVAGGANRATLVIAGGLAVLILLYDGLLKHYWVGPIGMGGCRFLNVLMGCFGFLPDDTPTWLPVHLAAVIGLYIVGVTWFARTEEGTSQRWQLIAAAGVMAAAVLLGATLPAQFEPPHAAFYFPYLLAGFAVNVGFPVVVSVRQPTPRNVQRAVKRCILGLIVLDAVLATAFVGLPGLLIGLLLLPATWLGKWVYST